jgi:hypothetical protein
MELFHIARPATKRRSGEAPEDEQERTVAGQLAERDAGPVVEPGGGEVGQQVADCEPVWTSIPRERRHDDLALVSVELLDVGTVAPIESEQAGVGGLRHVRRNRATSRRAGNREAAVGVVTACLVALRAIERRSA